MTIKVFEQTEQLIQAAADLFVECARQAIDKNGRFAVALAGGSTPEPVYQRLAMSELRDQIQWEKVHIFWSDERVVPPDDGRNNARMVRLALLDHVNIPSQNVHPIPTGINPLLSASNYERTLNSFFAGKPPRLDLALLGLGADGHTASLFPHTPALEAETRWVADVYTPGQEFHRITLTAVLLNQAAKVVFLVQGAGKASVLQAVLEGPKHYASLPAQLIHPVDGEVLWYIDSAAASQLSQIE
ncbi:MAG TPA: 6-phosphogluconolactonase [Anaerolineales bacterium]|nr:6-phosphogluconolactonase [Anaerolineales bacterium]